MKQKGFISIVAIAIVALFLGAAGFGYYQVKNNNTKRADNDQIANTTTPTPTSTPNPTISPTKTPVATKKPVIQTPAPTAKANDCSKFDKTKKAKVTIKVKTDTQPVAGSLGWFLFLKPGGECPGQTPGGVTLTFGAENSGVTSYTSPDLVPGQFRVDVTSANRKSVGITIDVSEGESTQTIELK